MKTRLCAFLPLLLTLAAACGDGTDTGDGTTVSARPSPWMSGAGPTRGHEDILRFGVVKGNDLIKAQLSLVNLFPYVSEGDACLTTSNELLKGNCHTDFPDDEMTSYYGVSQSEFGDHPDLQDLHALRNFVGDQAVSGKYACAGMKARIVNSTKRGLMFWQQGDMDAAMRWIGHATHTVQDSFTPCHTARSGTRFETLTDVCTYGTEVPGVCLHAKPDLRDRIWDTSLTCTLTTDRPWDCLVPQAQSAANATAGYLLVVGRLIQATDWNGAEAALATWFAGDPTNPESGYFLCDALKNDGWEAGPDAGVDAEAGVPEASAEASTEGGLDDAEADGSSYEASSDAAPDVAADVAAEASPEAGPEPGPEASVEAGPEASVEAGPEASVEAGADAQSDAAPTQDAAPEAGEPGPIDDGSSSESGCGCRTAGAGGHRRAWLALSLIGLAVAARRSRRP